MNTNVAVREARNAARALDGASTLTRYLVPLGRAAFAGVFAGLAPADFSQQSRQRHTCWAAYAMVC